MSEPSADPLAHCLNCNKDYEPRLGAICPHQGGPNKDRLPPWPKPKTEKCCHICDAPTDLACSDCRINLRATVYVCGRGECRDEHERRYCAGPQRQIKRGQS